MQLALMLFQLGLEALEQREGIRRAAGEAGQDLLVVEPPHLARGGLDHDVAQRHLAVAAEGDAVAAPHGKDGGAVILLHGISALISGQMARARISATSSKPSVSR
jgi:sugar phosphate isomerase/epimerase